MGLEQLEATATLDEQLAALAPEPTSEHVDIVDPPSFSEVDEQPADIPNQTTVDEQPQSEEPPPVEAGEPIVEATPAAAVAVIAKPEAPIQPPPPPAEELPRPSFVTRLSQAIIWPLVQIFILLDKPFSGFGAGFKTIIGLAAIATSLIAAATWAAVFFFPMH